MNRWFAAAAALVALFAWVEFGGSDPEPEASFARAERLLKERFADSRGRVEVAVRRLAQLSGADQRALFDAAEAVRSKGLYLENFVGAMWEANWRRLRRSDPDLFETLDG